MLLPASGRTRSRLATANTTYPGRHPPPPASEAPTTTGPMAAPRPYPACNRPIRRPSARSATAALKPVSIPPAPAPARRPPTRTTGHDGATAMARSPAPDDNVERRTRPSTRHRPARRPADVATARKPTPAAASRVPRSASGRSNSDRMSGHATPWPKSGNPRITNATAKTAVPARRFPVAVTSRRRWPVTERVPAALTGAPQTQHPIRTHGSRPAVGAGAEDPIPGVASVWARSTARSRGMPPHRSPYPRPPRGGTGHGRGTGRRVQQPRRPSGPTILSTLGTG